MQILVTGSNGQLGSELRAISENYPNSSFFFFDREDLDISNLDAVQSFFNQNKIDYIINCAAYTAVDKAEEESDLAYLINAIAVENLLKASEQSQSKLIQVSTDYVFGGLHNLPLKEDLPTKPESEYGRSKLAGETVAMASERSIIIRTSWLYSSFGHNFVKTIQKYGKERDQLTVVFDQVGTPTYAGDLAKAIMDIIEHSDKNQNFVNGIYHYANEGVLSWYDFALEICKQSKIEVDIKPVLSDAFPTPAKRPAYSVLDKSKIRDTFGIEIPYWSDSLSKCIDLIEE
jgi:dTDP-4-dehydrorhamnose reductase